MRLGLWVLEVVLAYSELCSHKEPGEAHTNDQGNHRGAVAASHLEALDQFLDFPDLDVLLRFVGLRSGHGGGGLGQVPADGG